MILNGKVINPGDFETPITLKSRTVATETGGFQKPVWTTIANAWAKWTNVHGRDVQSAEMQAPQHAYVLTRYVANFDSTCAVQLGAELYEVVTIDDINEKHEYMEIFVKRMVSI